MNGTLTFDMVYHPELALAFSRFQYFAFTLTSFLFLLAVYIILKKSTIKMKFYKYLILNQLVWSYLFGLHMTLWQPVILFPFFLCYSSGPAQYFGFHAQHPLCVAIVFLLAGMLHSIYCCVGYRILSIYYSSPIYKIITSAKRFARAFIFSLCVTLSIGSGKKF
jgi:hypothetical protein